VRTAGEWSLVYFGGAYSHAILKRPATGKIMVHAERGGSLEFEEPPSEVRAVGDLACSRIADAFGVRAGGAALTAPLLYLRIDVLPTAKDPLLSECEGVEPELFFRARPGSEGPFRVALEERLARR
jgi:hypothetical protein